MDECVKENMDKIVDGLQRWRGKVTVPTHKWDKNLKIIIHINHNDKIKSRKYFNGYSKYAMIYFNRYFIVWGQFCFYKGQVTLFIDSGIFVQVKYSLLTALLTEVKDITIL